jgi:hypothetical protein
MRPAVLVCGGLWPACRSNGRLDTASKVSVRRLVRAANHHISSLFPRLNSIVKAYVVPPLDCPGRPGCKFRFMNSRFGSG